MCVCVCVCVCIYVLTPRELLDTQASNLARLIATPDECHKGTRGVVMTSQLKILLLKIPFF